MELLTYLQTHGARVAAPLPTQAEQFLVLFETAEGQRYGVLCTFAPGGVVGDLSDAQLRTVGREMAAVHQLTAGLTLLHPRPRYDLETTLRQPLRVIAPAFRGNPKDYAYLQQLVASVIAKLESFDPAAFSYGYCHCDFLPKNFPFDVNGQVTFFDFD